MAGSWLALNTGVFVANSSTVTFNGAAVGQRIKSFNNNFNNVAFTGAGYWTATNVHSQLAGVICGIGMNTTNPTVSTAGEGEPACK